MWTPIEHKVQLMKKKKNCLAGTTQIPYLLPIMFVSRVANEPVQLWNVPNRCFYHFPSLTLSQLVLKVFAAIKCTINTIFSQKAMKLMRPNIEYSFINTALVLFSVESNRWANYHIKLWGFMSRSSVFWNLLWFCWTELFNLVAWKVRV